jgi:hypothetical protein
MPDRLFNQLITTGVSAYFLNSVTVVVHDYRLQEMGCWLDDNPAITFGNTIHFCGNQWYDTAHVTPALVHELVHVRQYQDDPDNYARKFFWENLVNRANNPYEKEAYDCDKPLWDIYYGPSPTDYPPLNESSCNLP